MAMRVSRSLLKKCLTVFYSLAVVYAVLQSLKLHHGIYSRGGQGKLCMMIGYIK